MNIESTLGKDLKELIKNAISKEEPKKDVLFHPGKVVSNEDPKKLGRCRIRVFGFYGDAIPDEDLPWADPDYGFMGSKAGSFVVPPVDAIVNVYFDNDDLYMPKYTTKVVQKSDLKNMVSNPLGDYPNTMVFFETDAGDYLKLNRNTGELVFNHRSGASITINASGTFVFDNSNTEKGSLEFNIKDGVNIQTQGDILLNTRKTVRLVSVDGHSEVWVPNTIKVCPFSGLPHGGSTVFPGIQGKKA